MLSLLSVKLDTLPSMIYLELCFKRILIKGPDEPYYNFDVCFTKIWCQTNKQGSNVHRKKDNVADAFEGQKLESFNLSIW